MHLLKYKVKIFKFKLLNFKFKYKVFFENSLLKKFIFKNNLINFKITKIIRLVLLDAKRAAGGWVGQTL